MTTTPITTTATMPDATSTSRTRAFQIAWGLAMCFYFLEYAARSAPAVMIPRAHTGFRHDRGRGQRDSWDLLLHLFGNQPDRRRGTRPCRRQESCASWHVHPGDGLFAV